MSDGFDFDWCAVFVASAHEYGSFTFKAEIPGVNISGQELSQCSQVGYRVYVWPGCAYYPLSQSPTVPPVTVVTGRGAVLIRVCEENNS